jgi:transposase
LAVRRYFIFFLLRVAEESFSLDPALALPVQSILNFTLDHIAFIQTQMKTVETHIQIELHHHPAIRQLLTIPGIGVEIGDTRRFLHGKKWDKRKKRFRPRTLRDAEDAVAKFAGLWWPSNSSGTFEAEERRLAKTGNRYLRYYLILAADQMRKRIADYAAFYSRKYHQAAKHHHQRALVLTARKSVGLFVGLLHRNEAYRSQEAP